jgi:S-(hydroxymethyl)glutathione dehydrogenase / alcohol dehydrogenase
MRAAVLVEPGSATLEVRDDVSAADPGPDEVRVAVRATGVCHSDLSAMDGVLPQPLPAVLGHEGAGEVVAVGSRVSSVRPGDRVVLCWMPPCDGCRACREDRPHLCTRIFAPASATPRFEVAGTPAYAFSGVGSFAERVTVPWQCAVPVPGDVPFDLAALLGCGVTTGVGAVFNNAAVRPGSSVAVIGCGGVGISVVQGARIAGAAEIVAVDPVERKRVWATRFGATHAVAPEDLAELGRELTGGGFDYVFEVVGRAATTRQAYDAARRGGTVVVVGAGSAEDRVSFSMLELFFEEKRLLPSLYGGGDMRRDVPRLIRLWRTGRLDLEGMVTARLPLADVNDALAAMRAGEVIRSVITFD